MYSNQEKVRSLTPFLALSIMSEHKQVRAATSQLASIVESAHDAIIGMTLDGIILSWNPSAERIFSYSAEEVKGHPISILIPPERSDEVPQILEKVKREERVEHYETVRRRKDGTPVDVSMTISPTRDETGKIIGASIIFSDNSKAKQAQAALTQLASIVESAHDAIIGMTMDGTILSWNPSAERIFSYSAEEVKGRPISILIPPERSDEVPQILEKVKREERVEHYETVRRRKDGTPVDVSMTISPTRDETGKIIGASIILSDNSKAKQAQAALSQLASIVESAHDAIIGMTLDGIILSWNPSAERIFSYSAEEVKGHPISILIPPERSDEVPQILEKVKREERVEHYETVRKRKDGTPVDVSMISTPSRHETGKTIGASIILSNNSKDKQAQAALSQLASIVESAHDAIIGMTLDGIILSWNPSAERIFSYSAEEVKGRPISILIPPERSDEVPQILERVKREERVEHYETVRRRKDGTLVDVSMTISPTRDETGKIMGASTITSDNTERKRAQQLLIQRTTEVEAANKELETFTYSVSHDLRAPLRHINGFSKILLEDFGLQMDPAAKEYLQRMHETAQYMGRLVDDLLHLARVGRQELILQVTGLDALVEEALVDLRTEAQDRQIDWQVGPLPFAECDPGLIKQVFANLLSNALKFTRPRERAVIEVGQMTVDGQPVIFVRDNGIGFDMRYADKMFGVFH